MEEFKHITDEEKKLFLSDLANLSEDEMQKWIYEFKKDFGK